MRIGRVRVRMHANPLALRYERFAGVRPVLDPARPLEVEVGCAEAQFLFERAVLDPGAQYVGLEIREDLVDVVNERALARGAPVAAVFCQAQLHMADVFDAGSIDRVYVNFPDPWFKRRQQNRRMVDAALADAIARTARSGADVFVQTDVWDIALDALKAFELDDRFVNQAGEWTFWRAGNPYGVRSWREQNAEATGLTIWRLLYRRN